MKNLNISNLYLVIGVFSTLLLINCNKNDEVEIMSKANKIDLSW